MYSRYFHYTIFIPSYVSSCLFQYVPVICSIIVTKVFSFLFCFFLYRHILAALHLNCNLHRDDKVNEGDSVPLKVRATRSLKTVKQLLEVKKLNKALVNDIECISCKISCSFFFSEKVSFDNKIILIAVTPTSTNSSYMFFI